MTLDHGQHSLAELLANNEKITFSNTKFTTRRFPKLIGKLWYIWSLSFLAGLFLFGMPPVMLVAELTRNRDFAYPWAKWGAQAWLWMSGVQLKIRGLENIQKDQSYVFVSNHRSYLDTAIMFAYTNKKMGVIGKKELLKLPVAGTFITYVNVIAIDRSNTERAIETMNNVRRIMESGISFGVYPEGTRALSGELLPFKKGAFHLAFDAQMPIIPMIVKNSDHLMGKRGGVAEPGTIEVVYLEPIETKGLTAEKDLENLRDKVRALIAEELAK